MIQDDLRELVEEALEALRDEGLLPRDQPVDIELLRPDRPEHGDFSTNAALELAGRMKMPPRAAADSIVARLSSSDLVAKVEVAGLGFINFHLAHRWLYDTILEIATTKEQYGQSKIGQGIKVQVEFGSPNPTGPITVGNARNIAYGDALAGLLAWAGFSVERENYVNNSGGQMDRFARSLEARYLQALGREAEVPEDGYQGDYMIALGGELAETEGMGLIDKIDEIREWGEKKVLDWHRKTLERFGVVHDTWVHQRDLEDKGNVAAATERLRGLGCLYEHEGATWFRATDFGHHQDQVIVRSAEKGSRPTYLAADAAYLIDKIDRGFDHLIYFLGADHHGIAQALMAVAKAFDVFEKVEVITYQWVNFVGGQMSKRSGEFITLDEMIDDVGVDGARFTFVSRSPDSAFDFDFDLVRSQSQENPVFYVQYAHTRPCALLRYARERGINMKPVDQVQLTELVQESELDLIRRLAEFPEVVEVSARLRAPYRLTYYARSVAEAFHYFYRHSRVISEDEELTQARLWLSDCTRQVLANTLAILGVSAPERM